jgi:hypothetical protein
MSANKVRAKRKEMDAPDVNPEFEALETAANLLIDSFPNESTRAILRETARSQFIPLWMLITGIVQRSYDNGEHTAPIIDPMWLAANPIKLGEFGKVICQTCGNDFTPRWPGEKYCGSYCGIAGYRSRITADRATHNPPPTTYKVGEEPPGVSRSTIYQDESDGRSDASDDLGAQVGELGSLPEREDPIAVIEREARLGIAEKLA